MCVETPEGSVLALPDNINPPEEIKNVVNSLKNSSNFTNHTKFLSTHQLQTFLIKQIKLFIFKIIQIIQRVSKNNSTNVSIFNFAPSPSSSTTTIATPSTTTATTPSTAITTTPSTDIITTPSSIIMTTPSSTYETTTPNPIPAPSPNT